MVRTSRAAAQTRMALRRSGSSDSARSTAATPCCHCSSGSSVIVAARACVAPTVSRPAPWAAVQARCSAGTCAALTTRPGLGNPAAAHAAGMSARRSTAFAVTGRPGPTNAATARARVRSAQSRATSATVEVGPGSASARAETSVRPPRSSGGTLLCIRRPYRDPSKRRVRAADHDRAWDVSRCSCGLRSSSARSRIELNRCPALIGCRDLWFVIGMVARLPFRATFW